MADQLSGSWRFAIHGPDVHGIYTDQQGASQLQRQELCRGRGACEPDSVLYLFHCDICFVIYFARYHLNLSVYFASRMYSTTPMAIIPEHCLYDGAVHPHRIISECCRVYD